MLLKVLGAILAIWLVFTLIGVVFKVVGWLIVAAVVLTLGAAAYGALKGGNERKQIR